MGKMMDVSKEYGIVLEGGGAKGVYQIGVWKALIEHGVKIKAVAGVSVGALNGALITMGDIERATTIWENITYSQIMEVDDEQMRSFMNGTLLQGNISLADAVKKAAKYLIDGGFDVSPLKELITNEIDEEKIRKSPIEFMLSTFSLTDRKEIQVNAKKLLNGTLKDFLLASSYFPAFKNEKIGGKKYMDGGVINNVPIDLLLKEGYKHIIVIRIFGMGLAKPLKIPEDVEVVEIAPRVPLGNILEFDKKKCKRNMTIGYYDGLRTVKDLKGKIYYLDTTGLFETEFLNQFAHMKKEVLQSFLQYFKMEEEQFKYRQLFETVLPAIAVKFRLDKDWSYELLYLSMLELAGKELRISKYAVYTIEQFIDLIRAKRKKEKQENEQDQFINCIIQFFKE